MSSWRDFFSCARGSTAIEYALIASLIAVVIVLSVTALGDSVGGVYGSVATAVDGS